MIKNPIPIENGPAELARLAAALAHPARITILQFLAEQDSCICGDIVDQLPLAQATVSQHLKVLREAGLISVNKRGTASCYCIDTAGIEALRDRMLGFLDQVVAQSDCTINC